MFMNDVLVVWLDTHFVPHINQAIINGGAWIDNPNSLTLFVQFERGGAFELSGKWQICPLPRFIENITLRTKLERASIWRH